MRKALKHPLLLRDILPAALKRQNLDHKVSLYQLDQKWAELVGPLLDRKSWPLKIYGKRLIVGVAGSSWANELEYLKGPILDKIRILFPGLSVEEIRFQSATHPSASI